MFKFYPLFKIRNLFIINIFKIYYLKYIIYYIYYIYLKSIRYANYSSFNENDSSIKKIKFVYSIANLKSNFRKKIFKAWKVFFPSSDFLESEIDWVHLNGFFKRVSSNSVHKLHYRHPLNSSFLTLICLVWIFPS